MRSFIVLLLVFLVSCTQVTTQVNTEVTTQVDTQKTSSQEVINMKITSPAFKHNANMPSKYTCDGQNINPQLEISDIPKGTQSLVLIVDDPDAPMGTWVHWVVWNIPVTNTIKEDSVPGVEGLNDFRKNSYGGPCPPSGTHKYFFKIYAIDGKLNIDISAKKRDVEEAMEGHVLAKAELIGLYKRV